MGAVQQRALPGEYVVGSEDAIIEAVEREPWNPPRDIARELGVFLPACLPACLPLPADDRLQHLFCVKNELSGV